MTTIAELSLVYAAVGLAVLYLARGWIKRTIFKTNEQIDERCGACDSGACATCKTHKFSDPKLS